MTAPAGAVRAYWDTAERRDWAAFSDLLADDVVYDLPQTRERVRGRSEYVRFNREFPGDWHITVDQVVADEVRAVSWVTATVDGQSTPAITFFEFDAGGLIRAVTDFWPEPYDPPAGREHLVERY